MEINTKSITILCFCLTDSAYMLTTELDSQNENGGNGNLWWLYTTRRSSSRLTKAL